MQLVPRVGMNPLNEPTSFACKAEVLGDLSGDELLVLSLRCINKNGFVLLKA